MKAFVCLIMSLSMATLAQAQSLADPSEADGARTQVSLTVGTGTMAGNGGQNGWGDMSMKWRAADLRVGREFKPGLAGWTLLSGDALRWDIVYVNEGHPQNNHRDGFALQVMFARRFGNGLAAELGAGPYTTMNTTIDKRNREINDSRLGGLLSLALNLPLQPQPDGVMLRFGYNHVAVPRAPSSNAFMLGLAKSFGAARSPNAGMEPGQPTWIEGAAGWASTNAAGTGDSMALAIGATQYRGNWAASITALDEGDDGRYVNQRGLALQGWRIEQLDENWSVGAGVGPYLARNVRGTDGTRLLALFTVQVSRALARNLKWFVSFHRAQTFREKNDCDVFLIGLARQFGG
ncbi:MAG: hypothetical protein ACRYGK_00135 [Janthinobacterium lividum]